MKTMKINNWQNFLVSIGVVGIFLLSSTPLLAAQPQDKGMQDDGVGIGKAEQTQNKNTTLGNTEGGTDPSGPRDRDPEEIKALSDRAKNEEENNTSQGGNNQSQKTPNAYSGADKKQ